MDLKIYVHGHWKYNQTIIFSLDSFIVCLANFIVLIYARKDMHSL